MPLYEYQCGRGHRFEKVKSIESRHDVICPSCGEPTEIIPSITREHKTAFPFRVYGHDGQMIHDTQTTDRTAFKVRSKTGSEVNL